jgi:lipoyl synthase
MRISLNDMVLDNSAGEFIKRKKPDWLRAKLPGGKGFADTRKLVDDNRLHTVCESAKCPNMGECWARGTATMMILGDVCTRSCGFCHIKTGKPPEYDMDEPRRVGEAAAIMGLKHLVITSVNRDELPDGGAEIWAETIREIRRQSPGTQVEVLIPDFLGDWDALQIVLDERPEILNHNLESVKRLYPAVRPQAKYERSIELLRRGKAQGLTVKTGIMVGIGERDEEIIQLMHDVVDGTRVPGVGGESGDDLGDPVEVPDPNRPQVFDRPTPEPSTRLQYAEIPAELNRWRHAGPTAPPDLGDRIAELSYPNKSYPGAHECCDILTIGQYLQPTRDHLPISRFVEPAKFVEFKRQAEAIGFRHCESGPLVRSSYHADDQVLKMEQRQTAGA